jgi:hypothetical protein
MLTNSRNGAVSRLLYQWKAEVVDKGCTEAEVEYWLRLYSEGTVSAAICALSNKLETWPMNIASCKKYLGATMRNIHRNAEMEQDDELISRARWTSQNDEPANPDEDPYESEGV